MLFRSDLALQDRGAMAFSQGKASIKKSGAEQVFGVEGRSFREEVNSRSPQSKDPLGMAKRSHSCSHCGRSFTRVANLRVHSRTHLGNRIKKPCGKCAATFWREEDLRRHIKVSHVLYKMGVKLI